MRAGKKKKRKKRRGGGGGGRRKRGRGGGSYRYKVPLRATAEEKEDAAQIEINITEEMKLQGNIDPIAHQG